MTSAGNMSPTGPALVSAPRRWRLDPRTLTLALTGALAVAGLVLTGVAPAAPLRPAPEGAAAGVILLVLAVTFFLTELGQALVEFRQQAYSFSLAGIPLLLGLLYCPPQHLVLARLAAAVLAFTVQRATGMKVAFNTASYLLDTALVITVAHLLLGGTAELSPRTALLCYVSLAVVDLVMSALVLVVIRLNDGPIEPRRRRAGAAPGGGIRRAQHHDRVHLRRCSSARAPLGVELLLMFVLVTATVYRRYLVLRRRHHSLEVVQEFIEDSEGTGTVDDLANRLLDQICTLVRATTVEFTLRNREGHVELCVRRDSRSHDRESGTASRRVTYRAYSDGSARQHRPHIVAVCRLNAAPLAKRARRARRGSRTDQSYRCARHPGSGGPPW